MSKKVVGLSIAAGVGLGLGYLGYKYGRQFLAYLKQRDDRKSINDIAEDIRTTLKKNMDEFCKKANENKEDIKIGDVESEKSLSEYLDRLKSFSSNKKSDGKHILSNDKAEKNLEIEINFKDDEEEEVKENKIKSVEDLDREYNEIIHEMNAETYKVLDILKARREELAKKEDEEDKKEVVSEEKAEKKPSVKKIVKVDDGKKKSDSNKKKATVKKTEETAE